MGRAVQADVSGWSNFMPAAGAAGLATDTGRAGLRGNVSQRTRAMQALTPGSRSGRGARTGEPFEGALRVPDFRFLASPPQGRSRGADREGTAKGVYRPFVFSQLNIAEISELNISEKVLDTFRGGGG